MQHANKASQTPCMHTHTETMREYFPSKSLCSNDRKHMNLISWMERYAWIQQSHDYYTQVSMHCTLALHQKVCYWVVLQMVHRFMHALVILNHMVKHIILNRHTLLLFSWSLAWLLIWFILLVEYHRIGMMCEVKVLWFSICKHYVIFY